MQIASCADKDAWGDDSPGSLPANESPRQLVFKKPNIARVSCQQLITSQRVASKAPCRVACMGLLRNECQFHAGKGVESRVQRGTLVKYHLSGATSSFCFGPQLRTLLIMHGRCWPAWQHARP